MGTSTADNSRKVIGVYPVFFCAVGGGVIAVMICVMSFDALNKSKAPGLPGLSYSLLML